MNEVFLGYIMRKIILATRFFFSFLKKYPQFLYQSNRMYNYTYILVKKKLSEWSMNMISLFTICVNYVNSNNPHFSWFWVKKFPISAWNWWNYMNRTLIVGVHYIRIKNWSETWFHKMLKITFECEFSVNVNSLTHH